MLRLFGAQSTVVGKTVENFPPQWRAAAQWKSRGAETLVALQAQSSSGLKKAAQALRQAFSAGAAVAFVFGAALQISGLGGLSSYLGAGFFLQLFFLAAGVVFSIAALAAKDAPAADDGEDEPQQFCWICHKCGTLNRGLYCTDCGASAFSGEILKCRRCGWEPEGDADVPRFCPKCGSRFDGTGGRDA